MVRNLITILAVLFMVSGCDQLLPKSWREYNALVNSKIEFLGKKELQLAFKKSKSYCGMYDRYITARTLDEWSGLNPVNYWWSVKASNFPIKRVRREAAIDLAESISADIRILNALVPEGRVGWSGQECLHYEKWPDNVTVGHILNAKTLYSAAISLQDIIREEGMGSVKNENIALPYEIYEKGIVRGARQIAPELKKNWLVEHSGKWCDAAAILHEFISVDHVLPDQLGLVASQVANLQQLHDKK